MALKSYDRLTRVLHYLLAIAVSTQLLMSLVMHRPKAGYTRTALETITFNIHIYCGLAALTIVVLHWLWVLFGHRRMGFKHLFPYHREGRQAIVGDLKNMLGFKLPEGGPRGGLPGMIHGWGFLSVSTMAITGGISYFLVKFQMALTLKHNVMEIHEFLALYVWIYLGAHVAMAMLHHIQFRSRLSAGDPGY